MFKCETVGPKLVATVLFDGGRGNVAGRCCGCMCGKSGIVYLQNNFGRLIADFALLKSAGHKHDVAEVGFCRVYACPEQ